ncbi:hypothetical protein PAST2_08737 [Cutibacterium acnes HL202PA1]|nr:hypothetical protein TIIST44_08135 [Cutibacterium acnes subsp. defendens ATCC 11828]AID37066.1 hypothetical protein TIA1EST1_06425 [Cutibacterium acnes hdn-1]KFC13800.1 hypothetical protein PAST2_08737 [Cutibacterium acnes HL202PA1]MCM4179558.1 hypothetical protein [Cutibacterium acnes P15]MCM4187231.1 hypothetical protein [Cutibacterium acnes P10]MCU7484776.1 hypothetical protein [Cutibacterium acnes 19B2]MCU7487088.1 hypothetical protein [Cutibacterium acnes 19B1]
MISVNAFLEATWNFDNYKMILTKIGQPTKLLLRFF